MNDYLAEWCIDGPVMWVISSISCVLVVILLVVNICKFGFSKANLYGIMVPTVSILGLIFVQGDYIENHVRYSPSEWINNLRDFSRGYAFKFFRHFFPFHIDIVIVLDGINRYIFICHPDHVEHALKWNALVAIQGGTILLTGTFSFLTTKMEKDVLSDDYFLLRDLSSTWAYNVALKTIVHTLSSLFFIFFTIRICTTLKKAAAFLRLSSSTAAHAVKYDRIITFSKVICIIVISFNFCLENAGSGLIISDYRNRYNMIKFIPVNLHSWQTQTYAHKIVKAVLHSKHGFYAMAYLWLKLGQK